MLCKFARLNFVSILALAALLLFVAGSYRVHAQVATAAAIHGTVTDSSGAGVAGATITVKDTGTGVIRVVTADSQGAYTVTPLAIGNYDVQAEMKAFKTVIRHDVVLAVGSELVINFTLPVGKTEETVIVQGSIAAQVDTTTSSVSSVVDQAQMRQLPLNGRNYEQLISLSPGVAIAQPSVASISLYGKGDAYSVDGLRPEDQAFLIDGVDSEGYFGHGAGSMSNGSSLGVDTIAEFQTMTNTYSAEYGGNGWAVNAVTRSGTNQFHGSALEFIRNSAVDAKNYFDIATAPIPEFIRNQFGGTLGGPIKRDKAFFFFNYEGLRQKFGRTEIAQVPDADAIRGYVGGVYYGVNPAIVPLLDLYPSPGTQVGPNGSGIASVPQVANEISNENYLFGRVDYVFSPKDSVFSRIITDRSSFYSPFPFSAVPLWPDYQANPNLYFATEERHIFSSTLVNTARLSFVRTDNSSHQIDVDSELEFMPGRQDGAITTNGLSNLGGFLDDPFEELQNKIGVADDMVATKGTHTPSLGFGVTNVESMINSPAAGAGHYVFGGVIPFIQNQAEVFIVALPGQYDGLRWFHEVRLIPYINDDWKVRPRLTLNLGLRYDFVTDPTCISHNCNALVNPLTAPINPATGTIFTAVNHAFAKNPTLHNFEPRIGFAYDPFKDHKTSIRAGFGVFDDLLAPHSYANAFAGNPPYNGIVEPGFFGPYPNPCLVIGPSCPNVGLPNGGIGEIPYNIASTPYVLEWNLNIQRQLFANTILTVGYVGTHAVKTLAMSDVNPPIPTIDAQGVYHFAYVDPSGKLDAYPRANPNLSSFNFANPVASALYDALQVNLSHPFSHGVELQAAYTYSKCIDIDSGGTGVDNGDVFQNPYDPAAERGECGYGTPQSFTINFVYELPFHGNQLVSGWQLSGLMSGNVGQPFTPLVGWDVAGYNPQGTIQTPERPNMAPGFTCNNSLVKGNPNDWFNVNAFDEPAPGTIGNAPRDCMRGPGVFDTDFSVMKDVRVRERFHVQLRGEFFNLFNNVNFQAPYNGAAPGEGAPWNGLFEESSPITGPQVRNGTAGIMTATSHDSRQIQLGLRFLF